MKILINARTLEAAENIKAAIDDTQTEFVLVSSDENGFSDIEDLSAVIVSTPLRSEFGLNYVAEISRRTTAPVIVLARADIADDVQSRVKFTGAFVLARPFTKSALTQTLRLAAVAAEKINRLEQEKSELQGRLDDARVISRAKCCLIQYLNFTEAQAHKHMQKLAMDTRRTQRQIAEDILRTYSI